MQTDIVPKHFGLTFAECYKKFEFSRTAEWNPYPLEGQRITCCFRKGNKQQSD